MATNRCLRSIRRLPHTLWVRFKAFCVSDKASIVGTVFTGATATTAITVVGLVGFPPENGCDQASHWTDTTSRQPAVQREIDKSPVGVRRYCTLQTISPFSPLVITGASIALALELAKSFCAAKQYTDGNVLSSWRIPGLIFARPQQRTALVTTEDGTSQDTRIRLARHEDGTPKVNTNVVMCIGFLAAAILFQIYASQIDDQYNNDRDSCNRGFPDGHPLCQIRAIYEVTPTIFSAVVIPSFTMLITFLTARVLTPVAGKLLFWAYPTDDAPSTSEPSAALPASTEPSRPSRLTRCWTSCLGLFRSSRDPDRAPLVPPPHHDAPAV